MVCSAIKLSQNSKINGFENVLLHIHTIVIVLNTLGSQTSYWRKVVQFSLYFSFQEKNCIIKAQSFLNSEFRRVVKCSRIKGLLLSYIKCLAQIYNVLSTSLAHHKSPFQQSSFSFLIWRLPASWERKISKSWPSSCQ